MNRFVILEHCYTTAYSGNENTTNTGNSAEVAKSYYNWKEITTWAERKEGFKRGKSFQEICIFFKTAWVYIPHTSTPPPFSENHYALTLNISVHFDPLTYLMIFDIQLKNSQDFLEPNI